MTASIPRPGDLLQSLIQPLTRPYTDEEALSRSDQLLLLGGLCGDNPTVAAVAASFAIESFADYLALCAWSEDEKNSLLAIKPAPPLQYIRTIASFLEAKDPADPSKWAHPIVSMIKSRQMWQSWLAVHWILWRCLSARSTRALVVSKTEDHGIELLNRAAIAYKHLPRWFIDALPGRWPTNHGFFQTRGVRFPNRSAIRVLPEKGGDASRSFSANLFLLDEAAFQQYFGRTWTSIMGGAASSPGRATALAISTVGLVNRDFYEIVTDRIGDQVGGPDEYAHRSPGLNIYRGRLRRGWIIDLDYSADPAKDDAWKAQALALVGDIRRWRAEYDRDWFAHSGQPLFPQLDARAHILPTQPVLERYGQNRRWYIRVPNSTPGKPDYLAPCTIGFAVDHGTRNPCGAILCACSREGDIYAIWDYSVAGRIAQENAWAIREALGPEIVTDAPFQAIDAFMLDPNCRAGTVADLYRYEWTTSPDGEGRVQGRPILPHLRPAAKLGGQGVGHVQRGIDEINDMLNATLATRHPRSPYWQTTGLPPDAIERMRTRRKLLIAPSCAALWQELQRGRYRDLSNQTVNQPEAEVDRDNHVRKALVYLLMQGFRYLV